MKNTQENKAKFFAQYWGQELKTSDVHKNKGLKPLEINAHSIQYVDNHSYLELAPLSQLTREDAIFIYCKKNGIFRTERVSLVEYTFSNNVLSIDIYSPDYSSELTPKDYIYINNLSVYLSDYLRSKGYAIPYMGLSVETLIEYGWIKLKE
jgi:hypothetical protein